MWATRLFHVGHTLVGVGLELLYRADVRLPFGVRIAFVGVACGVCWRELAGHTVRAEVCSVRLLVGQHSALARPCRATLSFGFKGQGRERANGQVFR